MDAYMSWVWLGLLIAALVFESFTVQLVSIWFAVGALGALLISFLPVGIGWQVGIYLLLTAASLISIRPLWMKSMEKNKQHTNADRIIGMVGTVEERISNVESTGLVRVNKALWSARSIDGSIIETNSLVQVQSIEGVKVMVLPIDSADKK